MQGSERARRCSIHGTPHGYLGHCHDCAREGMRRLLEDIQFRQFSRIMDLPPARRATELKKLRPLRATPTDRSEDDGE